MALAFGARTGSQNRLDPDPSSACDEVPAIATVSEVARRVLQPSHTVAPASPMVTKARAIVPIAVQFHPLAESRKSSMAGRIRVQRLRRADRGILRVLARRARLATLSLSGPRQAETPSEQLLAPWAEQIEGWLTAERLQVTRIRELLAERGCEVSYSSLRRFIQRRGWRRRQPVTVRMEDGPPGEVAEMDFGRLGLITDRSAPLPVGSEWVAPMELKPAGVEAVLLSVPSVVGSDFAPVAEGLGLAVSTEIEVWPAGLAPASWDGTGRAEWRTTDTPRIGLRANVELERLAITVGGIESVTLDLPALSRGESCFVELPSMDVGTYQLSVIEGRNGVGPSELGSFEIVVREPHPWASAADESSPLLVIPDPRAPTLEELWEGNATFHVYAPSSRTVECWLSLYESRADVPFSETKLQAFTPPLEPSQWRKSISAHLAEMPDSQSAFDRTSRCQLEFRAQDLGTFRLECERESTPVRWVAKHIARDGYRLRVVDDRGSDLELDLQYFSFRAPEDGQPLDVATQVTAAGVLARGGLYIAEWGEERQAVIVPDEVHSFQDLGVDPEVHPGTRSKRRTLELFRRIQTWQSAGLRGDLSALTRRNRVVDTLLSALVDVLGNLGWMEAEKAFERYRDSRSIDKLERSIATYGSDNLYGTMRDVCEKLDGNSGQLRQVCISWLARPDFTRSSAGADRRPSPGRQPSTLHAPRWLAEFALRLVSAPQSVEAWAHPNFELGLDQLFGQPKLLRAARFAVLIAHRELTQEPLDPDVLYTGWDWE